MTCVFCNIVSKKLPSNVVFETDLWMAIMDINPLTKGHVLIIPKQHHENIVDLPANTGSAMFVMAQRLSEIMYAKLSCDGINIFMANGKAAGQEVFHSHLHVIPRYENDGVRLKGKPMKLSSVELKEIARQLSSI